jgi:hypothetical protein
MWADVLGVVCYTASALSDKPCTCRYLMPRRPVVVYVPDLSKLDLVQNAMTPRYIVRKASKKVVDIDAANAIQYSLSGLIVLLRGQIVVVN